MSGISLRSTVCSRRSASHDGESVRRRAFRDVRSLRRDAGGRCIDEAHRFSFVTCLEAWTPLARIGSGVRRETCRFLQSGDRGPIPAEAVRRDAPRRHRAMAHAPSSKRSAHDGGVRGQGTIPIPAIYAGSWSYRKHRKPLKPGPTRCGGQPRGAPLHKEVDPVHRGSRSRSLRGRLRPRTGRRHKATSTEPALSGRR